jgi:cobalt/nickel transport system permease protein
VEGGHLHIPDGFIGASTSLAAGATAFGALGAASRRAARELGDEGVPLGGLVAAFIFAAQMLNFPVAGGTSGHLIGGALAAILVGPWVGAICIAVVLVVQALFADGGITALGLNVVNMAVLGGMGGFLLFKAVRGLLRDSRTGVLTATAVASFGSVVLASVGFTMEYALGGTGAVPIASLARAMIAVHSLIGIGEALITVATVGAVLSVRPDLVYGARDLPASVASGRQLTEETA